MPEEISVSDLDQRLQKQVENADAALRKGNPAYAIDVCSRILEIHPGCIDVRRILRKAQKLTHTTKSAFLAKAIGGVTNVSFLLKGGNLVKTDPLKALQTADKMLQNTPNYTVALRMLGQAANALNLKQTAVFAYEEIREIEPNNVENLLLLGKAYIDAGEPKRAVQLGDEILQKKPNFSDAETLIKDASVALTMKAGWDAESEESQRMAAQGQQQTAQREQEARIIRTEDVMLRMVEEARQKIESEPENMNHRRTLIENLRKLGQLEEALRAVQEARQTIAGSQDVTLDRQEGDIQLDIRRQKLNDLEKKLEQDSNNIELQKQVESLRTEILQHRLQRAKELVERYPNDFIMRFNLGEILLEAHQYDAAIAQFQLAQRNPKVRLRALQYTGLAFKAKNQVEFAVEQLQKAKEEIPTLNDQKKEIIYELGLCFEALGQQEKAISEYRAIYSADISYRDVADKINKYYSSR
jgi:tetratricopeptide (TPR) repeat protein